MSSLFLEFLKHLQIFAFNSSKPYRRVNISFVFELSIINERFPFSSRNSSFFYFNPNDTNFDSLPSALFCFPLTTMTKRSVKKGSRVLIYFPHNGFGLSHTWRCCHFEDGWKFVTKFFGLTKT
jgi:hypothetical protein